MDQEYPNYDEKIYNVVDKNLPATKEQEDVVLLEKKKFEERIEFIQSVRNKNIKKVFYRTLLIFLLTLPLGLIIRLLLTPAIESHQKFSSISYWVLAPLGAILFLVLIGTIVFEIFQLIFTIRYLKEKTNRLSNKGIKYGIGSVLLLILYLVGGITFAVYIIFLLI